MSTPFHTKKKDPSGGSGGSVNSVTGNIVNNTDPVNPVVTQVQADWLMQSNVSPSYIARLYKVQSGSANGSGNFTLNPVEANWLTITSGVNDIINIVQSDPTVQLEYNTIVIAPDAATTVTVQTSGNISLLGGATSVTLNGSLREWISVRWDPTSSKYIQNGGKVVSTTISNTVSGVNPTVNDDNTMGYATTSRWYNYLTTTSWVCITAATGAADWRRELFDLAKSNLGAGVDPTANDDNTLGYQVGSLWFNLVTKTMFICTANTTTLATWVKLFSQSAPGALTVVPTAYGSTVNPALPGNHYATTGGTGATTYNIGAFSVGDLFMFSDVDGIASSYTIFLDAGVGNTINGVTTGQIYPIVNNGETVMLQAVSSTVLKII